jgi:hypothetical protein
MMNNFYFVLIIFLNFYFLIKCSEHAVFDLDYFAYFDKDKIIFACSNKEEKNILHIQKENKKNCEIQLNRDGFYKLKLHLKNLSENYSFTKFDIDNDNDESINKLFAIIYLEIKNGKNKINTQLEYDPKLYENKLIIILLKLENGSIFYSTEPMCKTNLDDVTKCDFIPITNNTTLNYINFDNESPKDDNIILLQQKVKTKTGKCKPPCVNGICHNSTCYCKNSYMGDNCSICKMILFNK